DVRFDPPKVRIGGRVVVRLTLRSRARQPQDLLVDLAVHFVKARGRTAPKVFKVGRLVLPPRGAVELQAGVSLAVHTTRVPRPGTHAVDVVVNGRPLRAGSFVVTAPG
ncbi:MAG TPA: DNA alkylation repair protein, partial [Vicinamibacteria bacterium]|nr:DNA alkylation repair protein [Vicinamibacteria bacterium]